MIKVKIKGHDALVQEFKRINKRLPWGLKKVALAAAKEIMDESIRLVPSDTGSLRDSNFVKQDRRGNITFGYGGKSDKFNPKTQLWASEYAEYVHEDLHAFHPRGQAKFLEVPVNNYAAKLEDDLSSKLREFFHFD